jgi:hypothetical protein
MAIKHIRFLFVETPRKFITANYYHCDYFPKLLILIILIPLVPEEYATLYILRHDTEIIKICLVIRDRSLFLVQGGTEEKLYIYNIFSVPSY